MPDRFTSQFRAMRAQMTPPARLVQDLKQTLSGDIPGPSPSANPSRSPWVDPNLATSIDPNLATRVDPALLPSADRAVDPSLDSTDAPSADPSRVGPDAPSLDPHADSSVIPTLDPTTDTSLDPTTDIPPESSGSTSAHTDKHTVSGQVTNDAAPADRPGARPDSSTSGPSTPRKTPTRTSIFHRRLQVGLASGLALVVAVVVTVVGIQSLSPHVWPQAGVVTSGPEGTLTFPPFSKDGNQAYASLYKAVTSRSYSTYAPKDEGVIVPTGTGTTASSQGRPPTVTSGTAADSAAETATGTSYTSSTGTNVQVVGIDEGDIAKTDGTYIYLATGRWVSIIAADGANTHEVVRIDTNSLKATDEIATGPVIDIMLSGSSLVVLVHAFTLADAGSWYRETGTYIGLEANRTKAAFYDISDPLNPVYKTTVTLSGIYSTSRLLDGMYYLVTSYAVPADSINSEDPTTYVPYTAQDGTASPLAPDDVAVLPIDNGAIYSLVTGINATTGAIVDSEAVLGGSDTVYMSNSAVYLAGFDQTMYINPTAQTTEQTHLIKLGLNAGNLDVAATTQVPGNLLNQFSIDEYEGYLRVVTTRNDILKGSRLVVGLYVLGSDLAEVGSLPELVHGETVQSMRFDGPVGYVVTFERVDPLFALDLTDPRHPAVMSELKIPGFSSYLHPWGTDKLLGIGSNITENGMPGEGGSLKLSMFDVSDPFNVTEQGVTPVVGDQTPVSEDHRAAFVDTQTGLIGFTVVDWTARTVTYLLWTWDGSSFKQQARIPLSESDAMYSSVDNGTSGRAFLIDQQLYLTSGSSVMAYSTTYAQQAKVVIS